MVFVLTQKKGYSQRFYLKANRESLGSFTRVFQNCPLFQRSAYFYVTITGDFERFQLFISEAKFSEKQKSFFKKLEYRFLIENTTIENTRYPYKTAPPNANVKTVQLQ